MVVPDPPPQDVCATPSPGGRQVFEGRLRIRKVGSGCDGVGGTPVIVTAAGQLYARSVWQDPGSVFVVEIWRGRFEQLVAVESPRGGSLCVAVTAAVDPGLWAVRTCHAPQSNPQPATDFVPLDLTILYP